MTQNGQLSGPRIGQNLNLGKRTLQFIRLLVRLSLNDAPEGCPTVQKVEKHQGKPPFSENHKLTKREKRFTKTANTINQKLATAVVKKSTKTGTRNRPKPTRKCAGLVQIPVRLLAKMWSTNGPKREPGNGPMWTNSRFTFGPFPSGACRPPCPSATPFPPPPRQM